LDTIPGKVIHWYGKLLNNHAQGCIQSLRGMDEWLIRGFGPSSYTVPLSWVWYPEFQMMKSNKIQWSPEDFKGKQLMVEMSRWLLEERGNCPEKCGKLPDECGELPDRYQEVWWSSVYWTGWDLTVQGNPGWEHMVEELPGTKSEAGRRIQRSR
jgi:hypothetical protein